MNRFDDMSGEAADKVLLNWGGGAGQASGDSASADGAGSQGDADGAADDLVRLVLSLVETIRQLMEQQAVRRVESGGLSEEEIENLGLNLMRLEDRMEEVKEHFGLAGEDLTLRLGTVQDLRDVLEDGEARPT